MEQARLDKPALRRPWRILAWVTAALGLYLLVSPTAWQKTVQFFAGQAFGLQVGQAAPDFTLTDLDGRPVTLSELEGRPVVINFWASWCPPCRKEMPLMQELYEQYEGEIAFLAVAVDDAESPEQLARFASSVGATFPVLTKGEYLKSVYRVDGLPTTYFVDRTGVVRYKWIGEMKDFSLQAGIRTLLAP